MYINKSACHSGTSPFSRPRGLVAPQHKQRCSGRRGRGHRVTACLSPCRPSAFRRFPYKYGSARQRVHTTALQVWPRDAAPIARVQHGHRVTAKDNTYAYVRAIPHVTSSKPSTSGYPKSMSTSAMHCPCVRVNNLNINTKTPRKCGQPPHQTAATSQNRPKIPGLKKFPTGAQVGSTLFFGPIEWQQASSARFAQTRKGRHLGVSVLGRGEARRHTSSSRCGRGLAASVPARGCGARLTPGLNVLTAPVTAGL